jgi:hypothetical protein
MNTIVLDKKSYVVLEKKEYDTLLEKAASKSPTARKLSLAEGKKLAFKLIEQWEKGK